MLCKDKTGQKTQGRERERAAQQCRGRKKKKEHTALRRWRKPTCAVSQSLRRLTSPRVLDTARRRSGPTCDRERHSAGVSPRLPMYVVFLLLSCCLDLVKTLQRASKTHSLQRVIEVRGIYAARAGSVCVCVRGQGRMRGGRGLRKGTVFAVHRNGGREPPFVNGESHDGPWC